MSGDLTVRLVLTADGRALRTEIVGASRQVEQFARQMEAGGVRVERSSVAAETAVRRIGAGAQAAAAQAAPPLDLVAARLRQVATAGTQVLTTVSGLPGSLGTVANAGGRMAAALTGGFAGLAVQLGVIAGQMLFAGRSTEQAAEAQSSYERAIQASNAVLTDARELARQHAEQKVREALTITEAAIATERETLALANNRAERVRGIQARLEEAVRAGRAAPEQVAQGLARARQTAQGIAEIAEQAGVRLVELQRRAAELNRVLAGGAAAPAAGAGRAEREFDPFARLREEARRLEAELRTPLERYLDTVRRLEDLARGGFIGQETFARGIARAREELEKAQAAAEGAGGGVAGLEAAFDRLADSVQGFGRDAAKATAEALVGLRALDGGIVGLIQRLASGVIEKLIHQQITGPLTQAAAVLLRSGLASLFAPRLGPVTAVDAGIPVSAFPFHRGGVAGREGGAARPVPAGLFAAAPRLHRGGFIGPGEVPAILKAGEGVFTPEQMRALGGTVVQVIDQRGAGAPAAEVSRERGPDGRQIVRVLIRSEVAAMIADGSLDRVLGAGYGLQRAGVR